MIPSKNHSFGTSELEGMSERTCLPKRETTPARGRQVFSLKGQVVDTQALCPYSISVAYPSLQSFNNIKTILSLGSLKKKQTKDLIWPIGRSLPTSALSQTWGPTTFLKA